MSPRRARTGAPVSRIAVIGAGAAGVGIAAALAKSGHRVACVDKDSDRVRRIARGKAPFFEAGLDAELRRLVARGLISASTDVTESVRGSDFAFLCVGTPCREEGSIDTSQLESAASGVGAALRNGRRKTVVVKSTVVPGTTESVVVPILERESGLSLGQFGVCVNPEFLREGRALRDSVRPTHIVIGEFDRPTGSALVRLYAPFRCPKFRTTVRTAEAVKYATNAFLATKVTFANEVANLCTRLGLDADEVMKGMSLDPRINPHHLVPGVGLGGSCLPKDLRALLGLARANGYEPTLLASILASDARQPMEVLRLLEQETGPVAGKRIAILGLAFKPGTDDVRESKAIDLVLSLEKRGAHVVGNDPHAMDRFAGAVPRIELARTAAEALDGADACIIQAPWPEFVRLGKEAFGRMATPIVIDARRTWSKSRVPRGIRYRRIG